MMLVVFAVTAAAVYLAEQNRRADQRRVLDTQFQNQVRSFLAVQEARSAAITEKCGALARSVRLRAALEESDIDDLYRNALAELKGVMEPPDDSANASIDMRASFFRFFDAEGRLLKPENAPTSFTDDAGISGSLSGVGNVLRATGEQAIGFVALARGNQPKALREIVLTRIRDWGGRDLGSLAVAFPIGRLLDPSAEQANTINSGIWLNQRLYIDNLGALDRNLVSSALRRGTANYVRVDLESGPQLLFCKALDPQSQFAPASQICLFPLAAAIREEQVLRWKIIAFGFVVLACGFVASLFVSRNLSRPVEKIVAGSVENLTRRKQAEEDLRETNRELAKALEELKATQQQVIQQERLSAIGQMASGIAHDFNNTLTPILGFTELLLESDALLEDKEEARRCLKMLRTSAKDAASVVSRLREFYRPVESDEEFPIVDLAKIVQQAVLLTEPKWRRQTQARGVTVDVAADIKSQPFVAGQESALREVLTNLIFNAVDAMPDGGRIVLELSLEATTALLKVRDTGTGMSETVRQRCLEPFFSTKGQQGTGLGLSMVYGIVERHRGKLEIESAPGEGTTFIIRLPVAQSAPAKLPGASAEREPKSSLNVLLVDDDPPVLEVLSAYLRCDGHSVATAASGREGLEKFRRNTFDLVVVDRVMPEMSGEQTARFLKQVRHDIPVIMLTGFSGSLDDRAAQSDVIDLVLNKPITLDALRHTLRKYARAA